MKLETGWNFCKFVSESVEDEELLKKLESSLSDKEKVIFDLTESPIEFYVETYF